MGGRWRLPAALFALGAGLAAVAPVGAATPTAPAPTARAAAPVLRPPAPAAPRRVVAATPAPTASPVPLPTPGDASAAGRRRLRAINAVDEGFLLGLPGAGPRGPTAYVPPEPRRDSGDAANLLLAGAAGMLAALGTGAVLLFVVLRPRPVPDTPPARASVALPPAHRGLVGSAVPRRRPARLSRDVFDRLPPLVQLAVLDRAGASAEGADEAGATGPPAAG